MIGVPNEILHAAERTADSFFDSVIELAKWGIERRRKLACWRAIVLAEVIENVNLWRLRRGKKPRRMWWNHRRLIRAEAECEANKRLYPELAIACAAVGQRVAVLRDRGWV